MFVMLRKNWPGTFRRTVTARDPKDPKAKPKPLLDRAGVPRVLNFAPGEICELLDADEEQSVADDVAAGALIEMVAVADKPGKFRPADETRFPPDPSPPGGEGKGEGRTAPPGPAGKEGSAGPTAPAGPSAADPDAAMLAAAGVDPNATPDAPKEGKRKK